MPRRESIDRAPRACRLPARIKSAADSSRDSDSDVVSAFRRTAGLLRRVHRSVVARGRSAAHCVDALDEGHALEDTGPVRRDGVALLYRALAIGVMAVVAPTTAVCTVGIPVFVSVALGERPATRTFGGIALAIVAIVLVSQSSAGASGTRDEAERQTTAFFLAVLSGVGPVRSAWSLRWLHFIRQARCFSRDSFFTSDSAHANGRGWRVHWSRSPSSSDELAPGVIWPWSR